MKRLFIAHALALLVTSAFAQPAQINDVQLRQGNTYPWGAAINATGSQEVSQYNTSGGVVDSFRFLQGSSLTSAVALFTMSPNGMVAGIATGSRQGAGTINAQGYFINGVPLTGAPTGAAGGDLTGTYPNPTLAAIGSATGPLGSATVAPIVTIDAKGRVTALTSATITPAVGSITGVGAGCITWLTTPSSANLRGCLTDESGTGLAYFQGGDIGTPSAGNGSNITSLNAANLASNIIPAARTNGHQNGTATNDNAAAGEVGEFAISTVAAGSAVALTTNTPANITSISLTAGDWDVWGIVRYSSGATTNITLLIDGLSTTSATLSTSDKTAVSGPIAAAGVVPGATTLIGGPMVQARFSLSATTTVFLVAQAVFTVSTLSGYGDLQARRRR